MENRVVLKKIITNGLSIAIILFIIAIFFWPNNEKLSQGNKIDKNKTQIEIASKIMYLKESPSVDAMELGPVYENEVYTVLDTFESDDYYWYKIETSSGIVGYLQSDMEEESVRVISGVIDRTPPEIEFEKDFFLFINDEASFDGLSCIDDYSKSCNFDFELIDDKEIKVTATDDSDNASDKIFNYYNVYDLEEFVDETDKMKVIITRDIDLVNVSYMVKKEYLESDKNTDYTLFIRLFDENFVEINLKNLEQSSNDLCVKDEEFDLENYSNVFCDTYLLKDVEDVKYFSLGIKDSDEFIVYNSKYFIE